MAVRTGDGLVASVLKRMRSLVLNLIVQVIAYVPGSRPVCVDFDAWDRRTTEKIFMNFQTSEAADAGWATREAERAAEAAILEELELSRSDTAQLWRQGL